MLNLAETVRLTSEVRDIPAAEVEVALAEMIRDWPDGEGCYLRRFEWTTLNGEEAIRSTTVYGELDKRAGEAVLTVRLRTKREAQVLVKAIAGWRKAYREKANLLEPAVPALLEADDGEYVVTARTLDYMEGAILGSETMSWQAARIASSSTRGGKP